MNSAGTSRVETFFGLADQPGMLGIERQPLPHGEMRALSGWALCGLAALMGLGVLLTEHDFQISLREGFAFQSEDFEQMAAGGNFARRLAYLTFAALGVGLFFSSRQASWCEPNLLRLLIPAYVICGVASIAWSVEPAMTLRRCFVLICCFAGVLGLGRRLRFRELALLAVLVTSSSLVLGIVTEIVQGTFRPLASEYRFAGTLHPNSQGISLATLCLASFALAIEGGERKKLFGAVFVCGMAFLILTKSRTSLAGTLLGLGTIAALRIPPGVIFVRSLAALWGAGALLLAGVLFHSGIEEKLGEYALLGRQEEAGSLTGRIPLWKELFPYIENRPLLGYGYDSFWTPEHIRAVSTTQEWGIHEAHSTYLEALLSLGLTGTLLLLAGGVAGIWQSAIRYRDEGDAGLGFLAGLLLFAFVNAITESGMTMPNFVPCLAAAGLVGLATRVGVNLPSDNRSIISPGPQATGT